MAVKKEMAEQAAKAKKLDMISRICATIQGKFGKESVNFLGNRKAEPMPRIPSGSVAIDKVTGGGYPLGRIVEVFGQASSGKSTACYHAIAQAQKMFPEKFCAFVDSEYSFDPIYASQCGVQVDELVVSQPDDGTEGFGILQDLIEGGAAMVVVDSVAAMVPREEMEEEDYGKSMVGTQARLMSKALRKLTSIVGRSQCSLIFTNQTRDKIGVLYGCFNCNAKVMLSDGTTRPIKWIVDNRYDGEVKSVNLETGIVENKKIINWFDNGAATNWYLVKVQKGISQGVAKFVVGDDHTFITPQGELKLSDLNLNDSVYVKGYHYLSDTDMSLVVGGLLGDGSIKHGRKSKCKEKSNKCSFRVVHGHKQDDYCKWKFERMSPSFFRKNAFHIGKRYSDFESKMTEEIEWLSKYKENSAIRFVDDELISKIDLISLAIWYLDDGTYSGFHTRWGRGKVTIYCTKLDMLSKRKIAEKIFDLTGAEFTISERRLTASGENAWKFQNAIAPYVPKCMGYKMHQELFDKLDTFTGWHHQEPIECWNVGRILSIENVTGKSRHAKSHKYDIQIEGNSNYFVDEVLVHNSPEITTGGKALQYYASIRLKFSRISKIEDKSGDEKMFSAIETKVESVKNKTYRPFVTATFVTVFGKGIDNDAGIIDEAVSMGVLSRKGAYYVFEGQNVAKGMAALKQYLEENPEAKDRVKAAVEEAQRKELSAGQVEGGDALPPEPPPPEEEVEGGEV